MSAQHATERWSQYHSRASSMSQSVPADDYPARMDVDGYPSAGYSSSHHYPASYFDPENFSDDLSLSDPDSNLDSTASIAETPSIELEKGNDLLRLSRTTVPFHLLDSAYQPTKISLSAQLNGKFCLAINSGGVGAAPAIICYRRNLFSVTGNIEMPTDLRYIIINGEYAQIRSTDLLVAAKETLEGNTVKLIKIPWKSSQVAGSSKGTKVDQEPIETQSLTSFNNAPAAEKFVHLPLEWKRLQFRASTLNNGRRRELQQHFILTLRVIATLEGGERVSIFEANSEQVVVRGRSPRNFQPKTSTGNSRRPRSTTGESALTLTQTRSGSNGSFRPMALPMPSINYGVSHDMVSSGYPSEGIVANSAPDLGGHYTTQRSAPMPLAMYGNADEDYFSRRSRGSTHHSPRSPPYPSTAFSGYAQQSSSYDYTPSLPTTWAEYGHGMYPAPAPMPSVETPSRTPRARRHHSGNRQ